jgi:hypothetical protein
MVKNVILLFLLCSNLFGFIGKLTEVTGPTQVSRASTKLEGKVDVGVEMNDTIETLKARAGITFEDGTRVQCTEFSKLVIDEFVYDPSSGKGKLGLKASMGTVRYASGLIAKNNKEEVKVKTPTASISVRGTDFSMTVDELGRSLVILLPSLPQFGPSVVGSIEVSNGLGTVVLTKAYQATMVASVAVMPSAPVLLSFEDESKVNNMLLIDTPKNVVEAAKEAKKAPVQTQKADDDGGNKKSKTESKSSTTSVAQAEATTAATQAQEEPKEEKAGTLDINKLDPNVGNKIIEALDNKPSTSTALSTPLPEIVVPTATVNNGFTTDGVRAILYISNGNNVIYYTLKADTNATFKITDKDGTKDYPLNFGSKLKVNIIQK